MDRCPKCDHPEWQHTMFAGCVAKPDGAECDCDMADAQVRGEEAVDWASEATVEEGSAATEATGCEAAPPSDTTARRTDAEGGEDE